MSTNTATTTTASAPFEFLPLGAIIKTFLVGDTNIVQSFPTQELYVSHNTPFFGETIGRVANRVKDARLDSLNGRSYQLAVNNGPNSLHGGKKGWGKRIWDGPRPVGVKSIPGLSTTGGDGGALQGGESVAFTLRDEDGTEGYPGTVEATVTYTVGTQTTSDGKTVNVLGADIQVELVGGADETVVNVTNHSYFNLSGGPSIEGTDVTLATDQYLPVDATGIPTGGPAAYAGVAANESFTLGAAEPDIDDCFVMSAGEGPGDARAEMPLDTRARPLRLLVAAHHRASGTHLEVLSTEPAFQFYTGKYIDVPAVGGLPARTARSAFCVEPSRYVNAPNVEEWKGQVLLRKGEEYGARFVYRGWSDK